MSHSPFIHKLATEKGLYIYDVNQNQLVRVDEVTYAIIEDFGVLGSEEIHARHKARFDRESLERALAGLEDARRQAHLFLSHRPTRMAHPLDQDAIDETLDKSLSHIVLNLTEACNLRCNYCVYSGAYADERTHNDKKMTWEVARAAVDQFLAHSTASPVRTIAFYGGEPLLGFPLMRQVVEYVSGLGLPGIRYQITTNGTLLTPVTAAFMVEHDVELLVSVDGPQAIHDGERVYANGKGSFTALSGHLERLAREHPDYFSRRVGFECTVADPDQLDAVLEYFSSTEPYARFAHVANFVRAVDPTAASMPPDRAGPWPARFVELLTREGAEARNRPVFRFLNALVGKPFRRIHRRRVEPLGDTLQPNGACLPGKKRLFVSSNGDYRPCEKTNSNLKLGDVHQGLDSRASGALIEEYSALSETDCLNCWACRLCDMCYTSAQDSKGLSLEKKRYFCKGMRRTLDNALRLYAGAREERADAFAALR